MRASLSGLSGSASVRGTGTHRARTDSRLAEARPREPSTAARNRGRPMQRRSDAALASVSVQGAGNLRRLGPLLQRVDPPTLADGLAIERVLQPLKERLELVDSLLQGFDAPLVPRSRRSSARLRSAARPTASPTSRGNAALCLGRPGPAPKTRRARASFDRPWPGPQPSEVSPPRRLRG
jgi:hypothetical protein